MSNPEAKKRTIDPTITAAIITVIGGLITTLILNRPQTPEPTPVPPTVAFETAIVPPTVVPTDTVLPGEPTSTPAPPTDTPEPTFTFTPVPPVAIGKDWIEGCISALWQPYPSSILAVGKGNGCLQEPVYVFSADNGSLAFLYERNGNGPVETFGLFAPLPENGEASFKVRLEDLSNADLWVGIFSAPDIESNGLLMTIPAGNPKNRVIVQKEIGTYETLQMTQNISQDNGFSFTFSFNALSARGTVNPNVFVTNPVSIPSAGKWLFLGYRGLSGSYRIEGSFVGLEIK